MPKQQKRNTFKGKVQNFHLFFYFCNISFRNVLEKVKLCSLLCSVSVCYLFRCSHEVDGGVVAVVFLKQAEGELVVDQQVV